MIASLISMAFIFMFQSQKSETMIFQALPFFTLSYNLLTLLKLVILYFCQNSFEMRNSSMFMDSMSGQEMFKRIRKSSSINEGKFLFHFIWGANIIKKVDDLPLESLDFDSFTEDSININTSF